MHYLKSLPAGDGSSIKRFLARLIVMQRLTDFGVIQPCYKFAYSVFVKANKSPTTAYLPTPCPVSPQQGLLNSKKPRFARGIEVAANG